jgi:hypothetical protein
MVPSTKQPSPTLLFLLLVTVLQVGGTEVDVLFYDNITVRHSDFIFDTKS